MALLGKLTGSRSITFTAIFAAMIAVLDSIPTIPGFYIGIWDSWMYLLSPIVGILLGPALGAASVALGVFVGHLVYLRNPIELIFMFGGPVGAGIAGLAYQQKWSQVFAIYSLLLLGYFLTPVTWVLSLFGIWDVLVGYALITIVTVLSKIDKSARLLSKSVNLRLILVTVFGLEVDILTRIFILIPGQMYWLYYAMPLEVLQELWLVAGVITPIKVILSAIATIAIGKSLLKIFPQQTSELPEVVTKDISSNTTQN